jgi:hypothetical protein
LTDGTSFYDARTIRALTAGDTVTIANPTTNPETGLAKDATLTARLPAALDADGGLKIHVQNTAVPVTGTFWQATQPVSGTVTANAGTGPFPVSDNGGSITVDAPVGTPVRVDPTGTTTQPVSGTVAVSSAPTTAVTGPLTDAQLRASAVPVDSELTTADLDTGAGTDTRAVVGLARAESGGAVLVGSANPLPTTGPLTDTQLRATAVPVSGPLTDTQIRATALPVSVPGSVAVTGTFWQATQPVSGTVTISNPTTNPETGLAKDATLTGGTQKAIVRSATKGTSTAADVTSDATDANTQALHVNLKGTQATVPVTGTFFQATQPVSGTVTATGPLTDTQLRASAVPVSGTVTATGPLTDTQLRATPVPVTQPVVTGQSLAVTAATPITGTGLDVSKASQITVTVKNTVAATAFTGTPVIVFEQSDDNTSWGPLQVTHQGTGNTASTQTLAAGTASGEVTLTGSVEGIAWYRARVTTAQTANGMTIVSTPGAETGLSNISAQLRGSHALPVSSKTTGLQSQPVLDVRLVEDTLGTKLGQDLAAPLSVVVGAPRSAIFSFSTAELTLPTAAAVAQVFSVWHPVGVTTELQLLDLRWHPTGTPITAGRAGWQFQYISAENGTPGGTTITPQPLNNGNSISVNIVTRAQPTGAATTSGQVFGRRPLFSFPNATGTMPGLSQPAAEDGQRIWDAQKQGAIVMRASTAEGLMVSLNVLSVLTGAQTGYISGTYFCN